MPYDTSRACSRTLRNAARRRRQFAGRREKYPSISVEYNVVRAGAREALIEASRSAELLVVGARGRGGFAGLLLGSVSQTLLHHAHCPVTVVRATMRTSEAARGHWPTRCQAPTAANAILGQQNAVYAQVHAPYRPAQRSCTALTCQPSSCWLSSRHPLLVIQENDGSHARLWRLRLRRTPLRSRVPRSAAAPAPGAATDSWEASLGDDGASGRPVRRPVGMPGERPPRQQPFPCVPARTGRRDRPRATGTGVAPTCRGRGLVSIREGF